MAETRKHLTKGLCVHEFRHLNRHSIAPLSKLFCILKSRNEKTWEASGSLQVSRHLIWTLFSLKASLYLHLVTLALPQRIKHAALENLPNVYELRRFTLHKFAASTSYSRNYHHPTLFPASISCFFSKLDRCNSANQRLDFNVDS